MQTFITDYDFYKSACNLDTKRLGSQIYEGIHILASLLDCTDKLVNPKRNVKNHPAAKLWVGYEYDLLAYIDAHMTRWDELYEVKKYSVNAQNYMMLCGKLGVWPLLKQLVPKWITDELITTHRSVLIQKEIEKEKKYINKMDFCDYSGCSILEIQEYYHYRTLWPDCPKDLVMRYDWREIR